MKKEKKRKKTGKMEEELVERLEKAVENLEDIVKFKKQREVYVVKDDGILVGVFTTKEKAIEAIQDSTHSYAYLDNDGKIETDASVYTINLDETQDIYI